MVQVSKQAYFRLPQRPRSDAPLFVFLPGMDGTGLLLRGQTEGLEKMFDVRCLAIPPDDLTSWDELAAQVVRLIRAELADQPRQVYLCGESFGGCLAMKVLLRAPELFHRLILVNPASAFHRRPWLYWGAQVGQLVVEPLYRFLSLGLVPFLAALERLEPEASRELVMAMQSVSQKSSYWRLALLQRFDVTPQQLKTIAQPTLLIASQCDRLFPSVTEAEFLVQHLPHAEMLVLPNSGHACLLEAEVNLADIIQTAASLNSPQLAEALA